MIHRYAIKEIFATLQGEGRLAGTPSIFVRFSGCNLWTGRAEHRERDTDRHGAACPAWCDTDFADGDSLTRDEVVERVLHAAQEAAMPDVPLVVFTGGEPVLQLDAALVDAVAAAFSRPARPIVAIETNGTIALSEELRRVVTWICVSPKTAADQIIVRDGDELKVVYPGGKLDPNAYADALGAFSHYLVSPLAETDRESVGVSLLSRASMDAAVRYCLANQRWRLSAQLHKVVGIR